MNMMRKNKFILEVDTSLINERDYKILMKRWSFDGEKNCSFKEIGETFGLSHQRISQIMKTTNNKLKIKIKKTF